MFVYVYVLGKQHLDILSYLRSEKLLSLIVHLVIHKCHAFHST